MKIRNMTINDYEEVYADCHEIHIQVRCSQLSYLQSDEIHQYAACQNSRNYIA